MSWVCAVLVGFLSFAYCVAVCAWRKNFFNFFCVFFCVFLAPGVIRFCSICGEKLKNVLRFVAVYYICIIYVYIA